MATGDIPKARRRLIKALTMIESAEARALVREALRLMTRQGVKHNKRTVARSVTPEIIRQVHAMKQRWPDMTYQEIGNALNINGGRVSEILNGERTEESPSLHGDGLNRA